MVKNLSTEQLLGIVTLAMIIGGVVTINLPESTYYCESRDIVLECNKLSSTMKTCYYGTTYKRCTEGWEPIDKYLQINTNKYIYVHADGKQWKCTTNNAEVNSYTKCYADNQEAYLGEKV